MVDNAVAVTLAEDIPPTMKYTTAARVPILNFRKNDCFSLSVSIISGILLVLFFLTLMLISRLNKDCELENSEKGGESIINYIWSRNIPYFNNSDNVCFQSMAMIRSNYIPFSQPCYILD